MQERYFLNRETGETIDSHEESISDAIRRTEHWSYTLVTISEKVFRKLRETEDHN